MRRDLLRNLDSKDAGWRGNLARPGSSLNRSTRHFPWTWKGHTMWQEAWGRQATPKAVDIHRREGSPILRFGGAREGGKDGIRVELNARLQDLGFRSVLDMGQARQAIDQFLSNEMAGQLGREPLPISDELRRDNHGFDKHSFKNTSPGEKKARRKSKKKVGS